MPQQAAPQQPPQLGGIDQAQSNLPAQGFAGGGIVAFQNNEDQPVSTDMPANTSLTDSPDIPQDVIDAQKAQGRATWSALNDALNKSQANYIQSLMKPGATYTGQAPQLPNQSNPTANFAPSAGDSWDTSGSQGISITRPKKPSGSSASPTPTASAVLPTDTSGTSGIDAFTSKWDKLLADSAKDADKQKEIAGWTALANFGLGWAGGSAVDAQGHPVSALQNAAKAGLPALQGYTQSLAQERQQQQENLMQRMGLGIKGIQLGQSGQEVALKRQQLAQELPLQQAQAKELLARANYYTSGGPGAGRGGVGISQPVLSQEWDKLSAFKANPKTAVNEGWYQSLDPQTKMYLEKSDPTSPSYQQAKQVYDKAAEGAFQQKMRVLQAYGAKQQPQVGIAGLDY
jgi:hypothetical protein